MADRTDWTKPVRDFVRSRLPRDPRWVVAAWSLLVFVVGVLLLSASLTPGRYDLEVGQVAPEDIPATRTIIDRAATERARREAAAKVPDQYEIDPAITDNAETLVAALFAVIREVNADSSETYESRAVRLREAFAGYAIALDDRAVAAAVDLDPDAALDLEKRLKSVVHGVMSTGVKEEYLDAARQQAAAALEAPDLSAGEVSLLRAIAETAIVPNMVFNAAETQAKREEAMAAVEPVKILKGQMIVREGDVVTEAHLVILQDLGLLRDRPAWGALLGMVLIVAILEAVVGVYLCFFDRDLLASPRRFSLFALLVLLMVVLAGAGRMFSGYVIPIAAGVMLIAILLNVRLAAFMTFVFSMFVGFLVGSDLRFAFVALVGGLAGLFAVSRLGQRSDLMRAGLIVAGADALAVVAVDSLSGQGLAGLAGILWGAGNGVLSAVLTIGILPFLENIFGIVTSVKLLELANPNQPLLHKLLMEAPGTYHHSIVVGNLAEAAANEIGGDSVLVRVGALYHDIGKTKRPYFFIDNQFGGQNPHDKIAPSLSALIVTSHVRDGVAMAEEAGLPQEVIDLISQHHGTSLVSYFYGRAAEAAADEEVSEEDFRYEGPRPQTREAAILMLADACEAAVRSLTRPTQGRIEGTVRKVIRERLEDKQLEQSPLTFRDLDRIAEVFTRVLAGTFHHRVEYPEVRELKGRNGRTGRNGQNAKNHSRNGGRAGRKDGTGSSGT